MASKVQLTGGAFQDPAGNVLANGYLLMQLSQDAQVNGSTEIAAGIELKLPLDANGNITTTPPQYVWPNDVLTPAGTFYTVSAYTAEGQLVWGPNAQQIFSNPSPQNAGGWTPNDANTSNGNIVTYDIALFSPGQYSSNQVLLLIPIERTVRFAIGFAPSRAACGVSPTSSATFYINQNGTQVATVTFSVTGLATFSSAGGAVFNPGDVLTIVGPTALDPTLANVGILLSGQVVGS